MILENFSDANKQLIEYKPLFNQAVKAKELNFDVHQSEYSKKKYNSKSVLLICDFEGTVVFVNETFRNNSCLNNLQDKSLLDFLHQEDAPVVIEQLVELLQEKKHDLSIETRIVNSENQIFFSKWHVGYLRGLFYFYPIILPKFIQNATVDEELSIENYKSSKNVLPDQLIWKFEVIKTLYEWDSLIFKQIENCTKI